MQDGLNTIKSEEDSRRLGPQASDDAKRQVSPSHLVSSEQKFPPAVAPGYPPSYQVCLQDRWEPSAEAQRHSVCRSFRDSASPKPLSQCGWIQREQPRPVLSNTRGAKATRHLALLKTHGDGQEEERAGGGGAGRRLKAGPSLHPGFCRIHRLASGPSQHQHLHKPQRRAAHRHHGAQASGFDVQHSLC